MNMASTVNSCVNIRDSSSDNGSLDSLNGGPGIGIWDKQVHEKIDISDQVLQDEKIRLRNMGILDLPGAGVAVLTSQGRLALMDKKRVIALSSRTSTLNPCHPGGDQAPPGPGCSSQ